MRGSHEEVSISSLRLSTVAASEQMSLSAWARRSTLQGEGEVIVVARKEVASSGQNQAP